MNLINEITQSIKPGDDFYNFVNKKWRDANPIPSDKSRTSVFNDLDEDVTAQLRELLEKSVSGSEPRNELLAKKLYASGMDEARIEAGGIDPVLSHIHEIENLENTDDLRSLITAYHSNGRALVWRIFLDVDEKNSQRYVMAIGQGGLLLPSRDYYFEEGEDFVKTRTAYKVYLGQLFELLGKTDIERRIENVYAIEQKLAAASNTSIENRDVEALYNPYTFDQLGNVFGGFDWQSYRQRVGLKDLDGIIIHQPKFVREALRLVEDEEISTWQDYLLAQTITRFMPHLGKKYDDVHFAFFGKVLSGAEKQRARYKRVIGNVESLLPEPIGQLYVEAHFDESAKAAITDLVAHIQSALRQRIQKLDWMSEVTKQKALEKLDTFMPLLGYPDTWRSYESLELNEDYIANILAIRKFDWDRDTARATKPVDRKEWLMSPATINAYYWPNTNGITFPGAILQPPMFDATGDFAANYGGIGMVIGHEIIHGFDDNGSKYDKVGNLDSWWREDDRKAFEKRTQALVDQYDTYKINNQHVKGKLTLGENVADLGGMLVAYDALQKKIKETGQTDAIDGFTPEQRFFMSQARIWRMNIRPELAMQFVVRDPHAPAHLRVNGVVTNVDAWYKAWDVNEADALYKPESERIRIW